MVSAEAWVKLRSGHDEHGTVAGLCVDLTLCLHTILIFSLVHSCPSTHPFRDR